jgi:hypothetical protein
MTRETQTNLLLVVFLLAVVLGVWMWVQDQDQKAIAHRDYDACYTGECKAKITDLITRNL